MSLTPGFAPDARSQWQSLDFQSQEIILDEIERVASNPPRNGEYVLDPMWEEAGVRHYVFVHVFVDDLRITVVGAGTVVRNDDFD